MQERVKKREVFYLHGYDPRGARHYYALYKEHLQKQNNINNINGSVSKREVKNGYSSWNIKAYEDNIQTDTKYTFLSWTDVVTKNWSKSILDILYSFLYSFNAYIFTGLMAKYIKMAQYTLLIASYTVFYVIFLFSFSTYLTYVCFLYFSNYVAFYISILMSLLVMYSSLKIGVFIGKKIAVFWIFNIYTFTAKWARGKLPELDVKINLFVNKIYESIKESEKNDIDEFLIVAHSVGTMLSVPVLARLIRKCDNNKIDTSKIKLLTLGGDIPLISLHKGSHKYRDDLQYLAEQEYFIWLDYTSKIDGTCFYMIDPILSAGIVGKKFTSPLMRTPKFHTLFTKEKYKKLRYKWFNVHFWYLMSSEIVGEYDYFKMTAGSKPLESRVEGK